MRLFEADYRHLVALVILLPLLACSGEPAVLSGCGDAQTARESQEERADDFLGMDGFLPCLEPMTEEEFVTMSWESKSQMMIDRCIDEFSEATCAEAFRDPEVDNRDALRSCAAAYCPRFEEGRPSLCDDEDLVADPHRRAEFYHLILRNDFDLSAMPASPRKEWEELQEVAPHERTIMATGLLARVLRDRSLTKEEKTAFAVPVVLAMFLSVPVDAAADESPKGENRDYDGQAPRLVIRVSAKGFLLKVDGERVKPSESCDGEQATICLRDSAIDVDEILAELQLLDEQEMSRQEALQNRLMDAYDWRELYHRALEIRRSGVEQPQFAVTADEKIPFAVVVRIMDVLQYELEEERYESNTQFWDADYRTEAGEPVELFSMPLFQVGY